METGHSSLIGVQGDLFPELFPKPKCICDISGGLFRNHEIQNLNCPIHGIQKS
jgi:hypothetical protein